MKVTIAAIFCLLTSIANAVTQQDCDQIQYRYAAKRYCRELHYREIAQVRRRCPPACCHISTTRVCKYRQTPERKAAVEATELACKEAGLNSSMWISYGVMGRVYSPTTERTVYPRVGETECLCQRECLLLARELWEDDLR